MNDDKQNGDNESLSKEVKFVSKIESSSRRK